MRRNRPGPGSNGTRGFTLLELLISMVIFAVVVGIVLGAMRLGSRSAEAGEKKIASLERLRTGLSVLDAQIQSSVPLTYEEEIGVKKHYFRGTEQSLQLATNYSIWGGTKGYVVVSYRVETDRAGKLWLYASEQRVGTERKTETLLFDGLDAFGLEYFKKGLTENEQPWVKSWGEDETGSPEKVRVSLTYRGRAFTLIISVRARGTAA